MRKRFLTLFVFFVFLFGVWGIQIQTTDATQASHRGLSVSKELSQKIEQQVLDEISSKGKTTFWVMLKEKADLSPAYNIKKDRDRGDFVYQTLRSVADKSQAGLRAFLATTGVKYFPFWIANTIEVRDAGAALLKEIAARPDVEKIIADRAIELPKPLPGVQESTPNTTEWNLDNIKAPQVWSTFGDRGEGIIVANVDTGFQFDHSALVAKYRGNLGGGNFDHNYNWFDPSNICGGAPCDNVGHGSHTMGTMVGDDGDPGTNQIGVAPHAQFMGCKGCETNSCSFDALNSCGQFILAPTDLNGNNPDTTKRPHIVNNSWGGGPGDPFYQPVVDAWEASGIFPQFSAGNGGPGCNTVGSPGDYLNSYAAAAYDINNVIAGFSSRGPGAFGGEIKPNIAAPGVNVRSSVPTNSYALFSGTSMASPHVAGVVALMWSAAPSLVRDIAATRAILDSIAIDVNDTSCGGTAADNNVWGEGRLDALEAVTQSPICDLGTISGTVTDSGTSQPIAGAHVDADGAVDKSTTTDANGNYSMDLCEGSYDITASAFAYLPETVTVNITAGNTTTQDFQLDQAPVSTVTGTVFDNSGHGWGLYARIDIDGYPNSPIFTNPANGVYSVDLPQGTVFTFHVSAVVPGYNPDQRDVNPGQNPSEDFGLTINGGVCNAPGYGFSSSSPLFSDDFESGFGNWTMDGLWNPENEGDTCGQLVAPFPSPTNDAYYGVDGQCTYNNGSSNSGSLTMVSPVSVPSTGKASLSFYSYEQTECGGECGFDARTVEVSTDGGSSWNVISGLGNENNWYQASFDLAPYSGQNILIRFHFDTGDDIGNDFFGWMVDSVDMSVTNCEAIPGGLVVGNVYDLNTGVGLNGAKVTSVDAPTDQATTFATPEDPNSDDGLYILFSSLTGAHDFTASKNQYGSQTQNVDVSADDIVVQNFQLGTGHLVATPSELEDTVDLGSQDTQQLTITNDGNADGTFEIQEGNGLVSFKIKGVKLPKAKAHKVDPKAKMKVGPTSVMAMKGAPKSKLKALFPAGKGPNGGGWNPTSTMPNPVIRYGHAQCDETPDSFYVISGVDSGFGLANTLQRYDADTDTWTTLASYPNPAEAPTAVCFQGRIYVANGAFTSNDFFIYDVATDTWLSGASLPRFVEGGAMGAADGKIYLIGGDDDFQPADGISNEVDIYDIATDTWTGTGSPMPEGVSNAGMVQSGEFVYVVGGWNSSSPGVNSTMTQRYDMSGDTWEVGPTFDLGNADFALSASDTALYAAGGDAFGGGFFDPSNAAQRLDLSGWPSGSWADLGSPLPEGRLANNAGFCTTAVSGGEVWSTGGLNTSFIVDGKNMYFTTGEGCAGGGIDVPWLSENPATATVPAGGGQVIVDVTYDAAQVQQPGDYFAHLTIKTDTPYPAQKINVTMHVPLPANFGILQGTVSGLGQCDTAGGPIEGATVFIDGQLEDFTLTTDANGFYTWALDAGNSPVTITVSANKYIQEIRSGVTITPQQTTTEDFTLRLDAACLSVNPTELEDTVPFGGQDTQQFTITNDGAADANFELTEGNGLSVGFRFKHPKLAKAIAKPSQKNGKTGPTSVMSMKNADKSKLKGLFPGKTPAGGGWNPASPIPFGIIRYGHAQCEDSPDSFYIISGVDVNFGLSSAVARYDADTDTWTSLASYPNPAEAPSAVCFEGRIYVANGAFTSNEFFVYDIATDTWLSGATLPRFAEGAAMGAVDGKVYMMGGDDDFFPGSGISNEVDIYDIATDTWTGTGSPMLDGVSNAGSVQSGPFVYVVGGWDANSPGSNSNFTQRYDMSSDTWEAGPTFDMAVSDFALSGTDTALYAMGGDQNGSGFFDATDATERLDVSSWPSGSWADLGNPLPSARSANSAGFCTTAVTGGEVWTDGGFFNFNSPISENVYHSTGEGCAGGVDVPWLSENPTEGTIPADGGQAVIDVNYDASQVLQPGDFFAHITVKGNAPGASPKVNVTMHVPIPSNFGLLEGTVDGTGRCDVPGGPIEGATVFVDGPSQDFTLTTDANGHYQWYFDAANSPVDITVSAPGYLGATATGVVMTAGGTTTQDFTLRKDAPCATASPTSFDVTLGGSQQQTLPLTLMNAGGGTLDFTIGESSTPLHGDLKGRVKVVVKNLRKIGPGAPLKEIKGNFSPLSVAAFMKANGGKLPKAAAFKSGPNDAPWTNIAGYPGAIMDNAGAEINGLIYQVGGFDGGSILSSGNAYDPTTDSWSAIADMGTTRERPAVAAIDGLLYVTNGWDSSGIPNGALGIYDPSANTWTSGSPNPNPMGGGSVGLNYQGLFYVIGGCDAGSCGFSTVSVYDPSTDSWSTAANYPEPISWEACGDLGGQIYCAGGTAGSSTTANAYVYDSGANTWTSVAPMPQDQWAMGYVASDSLLYISGGVTDGFNTITNEGFVYDPASDSWASIENSNNTLYRGGSACGFYKVGGSTGGFSPVPSSEVYPGLTNCGGGVADLPWVSENPTSGSVPPDSSMVVDVTFDSTGLEIGDYTGSLRINTNDPGAGLNAPASSQIKIPLTLHVTSSGLCAYSDDFNDATREWIEEKPAVTQPGDGFLHFDPLKRKAVGVADSSFAGASNGTFTYVVQFTGGIFSRNWIYTHRIDKKNQMEVLFREGSDRVVVKQRGPGGVIKKAKAIFTLDPNTNYTVVISYAGTTYDVTINGTAVITGFSPSGTLPSANIGAAAKNDSMLIDNVCVQ